MYMLNPNHVLLKPGEKEIAHVGVLQALEIGKAHFPTGEIIAIDPFILYGSPFTEKIQRGYHSILLNILALPNGDERIAYAILKVSNRPISTWEMAVTQNQNIETLIDDEFYGYGVDTGTGSFMDFATFENVKNYEQAKYKEDNQFNLFDEVDEALNLNYIATRSWLIKSFPNIGDVPYFSTGYGDGSYPSYWGYDANGEIACLVTDFLLIDE